MAGAHLQEPWVWVWVWVWVWRRERPRGRGLGCRRVPAHVAMTILGACRRAGRQAGKQAVMRGRGLKKGKI